MKRILFAVAAVVLVATAVWAVEAAAPAKEATTLDNAKAAYQGSVDAKARYEAFAAKAAEEGYKSAAALFRAAAKSEEIRVTKYAMVIKGLDAEAKAEAAKPEVKSTKENIEQTIKEKTALKDTLLPAYIKQAEADKQKLAPMFFKGAVAAEGEYVKLFAQARDNLDGWKAGDKTFLVCTVCAFVMTDTSIKKCPVCSAPAEKFESFK